MKKERKQYDSAFKENAVRLSYERMNLTGLSRELGITPYLLYRWRKEYSQYGEGSFSGNEILKMTSNKIDPISFIISGANSHSNFSNFSYDTYKINKSDLTVQMLLDGKSLRGYIINNAINKLRKTR